MADILLSVGVQTGSAEFSSFISDLQSQINSINNGKDTEIKFRPTIDSAGTKSLLDQLRSISDAVSAISKKNFAMNFNIDSGYRAQLDAYKTSLINVANAALKMRGQLANFSGDKALSGQLGGMKKDFNNFMLEISKTGDFLDGLEKKVSSASSFAQLKTLANEYKTVTDAVERYRPVLEAVNKIQAGTVDFNSIKWINFNEMASGASKMTGVMQALADAFGSVPGQAETATQAIEQVGNSTKKTSSEIGHFKEARKALADLGGLLIEKQRAKLENANRYDELDSQAKNAKAIYHDVVSAWRDSFSKEQLKELTDLEQRYANKIKLARADALDVVRNTNSKMIADTAKRAEEEDAQNQRYAAMEKRYYADIEAEKQRQIEEGYRTRASEIAAEEEAARKADEKSANDFWRSEELRTQKIVADLKNRVAEIGGLEEKLSKKTFSESKEYNEIEKQLNNRKREFVDIFKANQASFTDDQFKQIADAAEKASFRVKEAESAMQDSAAKTADAQAKAAQAAQEREERAAQAQSVKELDAAYKDILSTIDEMGDKRLQIAKLDTTKDVEKIANLRAELEDLQKTADEKYNANAMDFSSEQIAGIQAKYDEAEKKMADFQAHMRDMANNLGDSLTSGAEGVAFDNLIAKFEKLNSVSPQLSEKMQRLKDSVNVLTSDADIDAKVEALMTYQSVLQDVVKMVDNQSREESEQAAALEKRKSLYLDIVQAIGKVEAAQRNWSKAATGISADSYAELDTIKLKYNDLLNQLVDWDPSQGVDKIKAISSAMRDLQIQFESAGREIKNAGEDVKNSESTLGMLESRLTQMLSLGSVIMLAARQIKNMAKTTIELDSAMTQLRVVTNASESDYEQYGQSVAGTAKEIGASITDLIDSTTVYARLGYSLDESSNLAKYTAMLSNVGDIDVSTAQDALTAITKAFKDVEASNIEAAMDKMVAVGNNFPISVSQIAEGMNNAGSALAAAGNSFQESIALLTAANTTVQNVSKSSTGLRTITARIRGTKLELDELGETIEVAKYQEALDLLTGKGVKLTQNGEFRSTYDILKDIASVWDDLSNMEQANIAEQLAGKICCCCPGALMKCA